MKIKLPQQSLNLLREFLGTPGLSKKPDDIYLDGELLVRVLPQLDLSWLLTPAEHSALPAEGRLEYKEKDETWTKTELDIELTDKQRDRIRDRLTKVLELRAVPNGEFIFRLYKEFGFGPAA